MATKPAETEQTKEGFIRWLGLRIVLTGVPVYFIWKSITAKNDAVKQS